VHDDTLVVGGLFIHAGSEFSLHIARWGPPDPVLTSQPSDQSVAQGGDMEASPVFDEERVKLAPSSPESVFFLNSAADMIKITGLNIRGVHARLVRRRGAGDEVA
jgi:hypothetical protein